MTRDTPEDIVFDEVNCFVLMADDFKNTNAKDIGKALLGDADQLARRVMTSQPIARTWPIAFGRLGLLRNELGENDTTVTAANTADNAF